MLIGILNVTCLGCGLLSIVIASSVAFSALLGTLISKMLSHSGAAYERKIWGPVESLKTYIWVEYDIGWDLCCTSTMNWPRESWRVPL